MNMDHDPHSRFERNGKEPERKGKEPAGAPEYEDPEEEIPRFSPEEEADLLAQYKASKATANSLFRSSSYNDALSTYATALSVCPNYLDFEIAMLKSNIAACHVMLGDWKEAAKAASDALKNLENLDKEEGKSKAEEEVEGLFKKREGEKVEEEEADEEIVSAGAQKAEDVRGKGEIGHEAEEKKRQRREDVEMIRMKSLMRRARARSELGGWSDLKEAEEDYKQLSSMKNLSAADRKIVNQQLRLLPARTQAAQEKETGEVVGKFKELGNAILKNFGLSTDNFQMTKDEKTGGYSMNFNGA